MELPSPWGEGDVHLLTCTLAYSGKTRGAFAESEDQPHLIEAIDRVLRQFGGTARRWRFDRMGTVVTVGRGEVLASFAAVAKHYGVGLDICPPRRGNRKGCFEKAIHFGTQRWWRTAVVTSPEQATPAFEKFQRETGDARERYDVTVAEAALREHLLSLPAAPYPATLSVSRRVSAGALVDFRGLCRGPGYAESPVGGPRPPFRRQPGGQGALGIIRELRGRRAACPGGGSGRMGCRTGLCEPAPAP